MTLTTDGQWYAQGAVYYDDVYRDVTMTQPDAEDLLLFEMQTPDASRGAYIIFMDGDYYEAKRETAPGEDGGAERVYWTNGSKFDISLLSFMRADQLQYPAEYSAIGEEGQGVAFVQHDTTLKTSGLLSCVAWLIYNDDGAYLTHILVPASTPDRIRSEIAAARDGLQRQARALVELFKLKVGSSPGDVVIRIDGSNPAYVDDSDPKHGEAVLALWSEALNPSSLTCDSGFATDLSHVVETNTKFPAVVWNGGAVKSW